MALQGALSMVTSVTKAKSNYPRYWFDNFWFLLLHLTKTLDSFELENVLEDSSNPTAAAVECPAPTPIQIPTFTQSKKVHIIQLEHNYSSGLFMRHYSAEWIQNKNISIDFERVVKQKIESKRKRSYSNQIDKNRLIFLNFNGVRGGREGEGETVIQSY